MAEKNPPSGRKLNAKKLEDLMDTGGHLNDNDGECSSEDDIQYLPQEDNDISSHQPQQESKPELIQKREQYAYTDMDLVQNSAGPQIGKEKVKNEGPITQNCFSEKQIEEIQDRGNGRDEKYLKSLGLPASFNNRPFDEYPERKYEPEKLQANCFTGAGSYKDQQVIRKGQKETFYCEYCLIDLNSRDTLSSHTKGAKHMRKVEQHETELQRGRNQGYHVEEKSVKQIANPLPLQKKVPIPLKEKLRETTTAIVGLNFVNEIIACSNAEVEPHYECRLCGQQGEANAMFQHLQGKPHRGKFLRDKYPNNRSYIDQSLNQNYLEMEIERLRLRENSQLNKINTVYSDEMFPWTAGKAPWCVEQGGTGNVPTNARNKVGLIGSNSMGSETDSRHLKIENGKAIKSLNDIDLDTIEINLKTDMNVKKAWGLIQKLNEKVKDYMIENGKEEDAYNLELLCLQVDAIAETLGGLKSDAINGETSKKKRYSPTLNGHDVKREPSPRDGNDRSRQSSSETYDPNERSHQYEERGHRRSREDSRERDREERGYDRENRNRSMSTSEPSQRVEEYFNGGSYLGPNLTTTNNAGRYNYSRYNGH